MTVSHIFPYKMAVTKALFWVSLISFVIGTYGSRGELSILHSPASVKFSGKSSIPESLIKELFSAALGLSVEENSDWKGLYVTDPFNTPEAVVEVYVDGVSSLHDNGGKTFPVIVDEYNPDTYKALSHRIRQRFTTGSNKIVNIVLSDEKQLGENVFGVIDKPKHPNIHLVHLKYNVDEDIAFIQELELLKSFTEKINSGVIVPDNVIDFYNFRFTSLHPLSDLHGPDSLQTLEAKKLLSEAIQDLNKAFIAAYDGSVLVATVVTDVVHTRKIRAAEDAPATVPLDADISTDDYDADYPAIFNILLWFGIVFVFTLIAIVYAIMDMDPGRDSIIYRMTSTRMKKDN